MFRLFVFIGSLLLTLVSISTAGLAAELGELLFTLTAATASSAQVGFDIAALKPELKHLIQPRVDAFDFLARLHASGRQVLLATNAHRASLELKLAETTMGQWFHALVRSHDYGHAKEEQAFWQRLRQEHPFDPARTLFLDDSEAVLDSARRFGIARLISIVTPDSQTPPRTGLRYPAIDRFAELALPDSAHAPRELTA